MVNAFFINGSYPDLFNLFFVNYSYKIKNVLYIKMPWIGWIGKIIDRLSAEEHIIRLYGSGSES